MRIDKIFTLIPDPKFKELGETRYNELVSWFRERLDDAIRAAEEEKEEAISGIMDGKKSYFIKHYCGMDLRDCTYH